MATIDQVVNVSITATSATPSLPGVDIPAIIAYHTHNTDLVRTYFDVTDMVTDGFGVNEPAYLAALALISQDPRPAQFKVIRATGDYQQTMTFKVTNLNAGAIVGLTFRKPDGTTVDWKRTNPGAETAIQIATALVALAPAGVTMANGGGTLDTVTITVTTHHNVWYPRGVLTAGGDYLDTTGAPTGAALGTDLDAAVLVDPNFYGLSGVLMSDAAIQAIAVWAEANKRLHSYTTPNTDNINTNNAGIFQTLKTAAYNYSIGLYKDKPEQYGGVAWEAQRFTADPGSDTWAYKTLEAVDVDALTPTQITNAGQLVDPATKNGNVYISIANTNNTVDGRCASGMYADIRRGIDAMSRDIQIAVFTAIKNNPKLPYTRKGIATIGGEIAGVIKRYIASGFISNDAGFEYQIQLPDLATISTSDKQKRKLRNVKFTCTAQGAIQTVFVQGSLNF